VLDYSRYSLLRLIGVILRRLVPRSGGTLKHATANRGWFANVLPYGSLTKWLRPVVEVDLTDADINDETLHWVVHNGPYLEKLILDGNPNVTNKSAYCCQSISV